MELAGFLGNDRISFCNSCLYEHSAYPSDGGHVMFLIYEVVARRKPNEKFMEYAQIAGMILLLALVLYANGMDLVRAIF